MTDDGVTDGQLLAALRDLTAELGCAPTLRQVAGRVGWRTPSAAHVRVGKLRDRGLVHGAGRSLTVAPDPSAIEDRIADLERAAGPAPAQAHLPPSQASAWAEGWREGFLAGLRA